MAKEDVDRADAAQKRLDKAKTETEKLAIGRELREATEMTGRRIVGADKTSTSNTNPDGTLKK